MGDQRWKRLEEGSLSGGECRESVEQRIGESVE